MTHDEDLKRLLTAEWTPPAASPDAVTRLIAAAEACPPVMTAAPRRWRWALPSGLAVAAAVAAFWMFNPGAVAPGTVTPLLDDPALQADALEHVFSVSNNEEWM